LAERPDLLATVAKSPGPFLLAPRRFADGDPVQVLHSHLERVPAYEMTGAVDFERGSALCLDLLRDPGHA
jgi:hypothetical protein